MECIQCHTPLSPQATFCPACGARQPELLPEFQQGLARYQDLLQQRAAGRLNEAGFQAALNGLSVRDAQGAYWTLRGEPPRWFRFDGQTWQPLEAPRRPVQAAPPRPAPVPVPPAMARPPAAPTPKATRPVQPWVWILLAAGLLIVIICLALAGWRIAQNQSWQRPVDHGPTRPVLPDEPPTPTLISPAARHSPANGCGRLKASYTPTLQVAAWKNARSMAAMRWQPGALS